MNKGLDVRSEAALLGRLLRQARPYLPRLAGVLVLQLLATPLALLGPVPLQLAVDSVVHGRPVPSFLRGWLPGATGEDPRALLLSVCFLSLGIALLVQVQSLASSLLTVATGQRLVLEFRSRLFRHAERLSLSYHTRRGTADTLYRIQADATAVEWVFIEGAVPLVASAFTLVSLMYVVLRLDWRIGCTALVVAPVLFVLTRSTRPLLRSRSRELKRQESATLGIVQEVLGILPVVKAFGQEKREQERFTCAADACIRGRLRLTLAEGTLGLVINLVAAGGIAAVLYIGASGVLAGALTLGELLLITSYVSQLYTPLRTLSRKSVSLQAQLAGAERAFALLDEQPDVPERAGALALPRARGEVKFRNVSFAYDSDRPALQNVSFGVPAGARVGIVGATGAGTTTLTYLLTRLHDPEEGAILLDGTDLRDYRLADLRAQFAVVFQEPVLFAASIVENIAYARPGAGREAIIRAARAADIHDFIVSLPDQYDTRVGERGLALSGGERQRISLARAFLRDAPVLILDEPTSSVDVGTELVIMEALERLMSGRTTFIIAHRANTVAGCDVLLRLDQGRLEVVREPSAIQPGLMTPSPVLSAPG